MNWREMFHRRWVVLCITDNDGWIGALNADRAYPAVRRIPANRRSTVIYDDRDTAEREAERLACIYPNQEFAVLGIERVVVGRLEPWNGAMRSLPKWDPPLSVELPSERR